MYIHYTLGAIFIIFILCVHCDNAASDNEIKEIYVPSAPQILTAKNVTANEIHLLWAPPLTFTLHALPNPVTPAVNVQNEPSLPDNGKKPQNDEPDNDVIAADSITPEGLKDTSYNWFKNDKQKYSDEYSNLELLSDSYRIGRDLSFKRHRKRRHDSANDTKNLNLENFEYVETHQAFEFPVVVVKKSSPAIKQHKDSTQVAYVLYYEQGVPRYDLNTVNGVQTSPDVKKKNVFPSDLGMEEYSRATKNLTLLNTSGKVTKVVFFRLKNLIPFTPYKVWVRAFYNFPLENVSSSDLLQRLGPKSDPLYVLTDVSPPSAPIIVNLTCDRPKRTLHLQWRQPLEYNNSIDQYVVTLRKLPEQQPRTRLTLPTNKNDIETIMNMEVELWNVTRYEVKIYAVTKSVTKQDGAIVGAESPPKEISSEWCAAHSEAMSPADVPHTPHGASTAALLAILPLALLAAVGIALLYWRCRSRLSKCISAAYNYLEEGGERAARAPLNKKPVKCTPLRACATGGAEVEGEGLGEGEPPSKPPRMATKHHPAVPRTDFPQHVAALHADGDIGFSREYEIVVAQSNALGHTSHHSHRPENRLKNRYLNITAYDHSRVCVSAGGKCGASGCVGGGAGAGRGAACDYVNANFIDGMLPHLQPQHVAAIRRKLDRRNRPHRQPSVKPAKPPPNLAEGIESAFLNIEFSGIVESDEQNEDSDSERSDDDCELDDVYVDIEGVPTRVKLEWLVWRRRYIATQGPTPATLDAFWRMIWQHRVHTIVMITNLVERGRRKCDMYWPAGGRGSSAEFGGVHVTLLHEDVRAAYTVRHMRARNTRPENDSGSESTSPDSEAGNPLGRSVVQYHYTVWPDHGTPRHPLAVLPFVHAAAQHPDTVLVHCSAGVGRTGTYIVLDAQLNQLKLTGTLSPLGFLCRARTQRNHLVQTEEQYVFVHDALLEHVRSGDTEVHFTKTRDYLTKLLEPITEDELAVLDLTPPRRKSVNDLNGVENGEGSSLKSSQICSASAEAVENGSQVSIKTDDLNSEMSKSSANNETQDDQKVLANGEESEGVYDLAPRSTDTYTKKMAAYNNMSDEEKEEIRRVNRAENYALLERMRSLANRHHTYQGPPPSNLLEKQFQLITRSCVDASVCARAPHNAEKNRVGGVLPSDTARVMLVPKPGVEGSEYVNASWVCGRRRLREYAVAQHPIAESAADLWRLLWDHTAQLVLLLSDTADPECEIFWPTEDEKELFVANFRASFVSKDTYVAYRKSEKKSPMQTPAEPETNGYRRQESECADDERLIPENSSPIKSAEPAYRFDRTELRLERLSSGNRDLSARKSIANGDLFSSLSEPKKNGPKSPRSPSKMSLKNFKLSSPTKFKFPEWGSRVAGSPPDTAPPPPPVAPSLSVEEETELRRPCYRFDKVTSVPDNVPSDRVIEVTNVSVHSLQDDYQLSVKFIKCSGWLDGDTTEYTIGKPDENVYVKALRAASTDSERQEALDRLTEPYQDSFALIEYVAGCQMEYKNGPVVVVDKYGGWKAMSFCTLSAACGGVRDPAQPDPCAQFRPPSDDTASLYCWGALGAHARCARDRDSDTGVHSHSALLAQYCALANYGQALQIRADR